MHVEAVKAYLDIREINGYSIDFVPFHVPVKPRNPTDHESIEKSSVAPIRCLVYIGLPNNPQFLGVQDPDELAKHIVKSKGPSGENKEYVYMLAEALEQLRKDAGVKVEVDEHVADLAMRVRAVEDERRGR